MSGLHRIAWDTVPRRSILDHVEPLRATRIQPSIIQSRKQIIGRSEEPEEKVKETARRELERNREINFRVGKDANTTTVCRRGRMISE